ncbi:MAG: hypothetical protein Q4G16_05955 [Cruoricaptor ignavus]|nr:hypothetical protein [Cruoricaptor ignavus]
MNLYEQNKEKTRVLIGGQTTGIAELVIHILNFNDRKIDYILENGKSQIDGEDFVLLETNDTHLAKEFHPNIVLLAEQQTDNYTDILENIVGGGIFIYPENQSDLEQKMEEIEIFFRKISYQLQQPNVQNGQSFVSTEFGEFPVNITSTAVLEYMDGIKTLSQHLGIMDEEFYEALGSF